MHRSSIVYKQKESKTHLWGDFDVGRQQEMDFYWRKRYYGLFITNTVFLLHKTSMDWSHVDYCVDYWDAFISSLNSHPEQIFIFWGEPLLDIVILLN